MSALKEVIHLWNTCFSACTVSIMIMALLLASSMSLFKSRQKTSPSYGKIPSVLSKNQSTTASRLPKDYMVYARTANRPGEGAKLDFILPPPPHRGISIDPMVTRLFDENVLQDSNRCVYEILCVVNVKL